jgi:pimeloyl-ACP methyl ester carboxylesterase
MAPIRFARFSALGPSLHSFAGDLPPGTHQENVPIVAEDGGESSGVLYTRGGEKTVVVLIHPRGDMSRYFAIPYLLEAGYAVWGQRSRSLYTDISVIFETLLADVATGLRFLKEQRAYAHTVLFGFSGGGSVYMLYQAQATTPPPLRLTDTAAGEPYDLNRFVMIPGDAMVQMSAHLGQGIMMQNAIDPSVTDEDDPLSLDPELDMYSPRNGFVELPGRSQYSPDFVAKYRAGQRARVARIDAIARGLIEEQRPYRQLMAEPGYDARPLVDRQHVYRRAVLGRTLEIHRTEANLAYTDLSLYPSDREVGSFFALRPDLVNYSEGGFGKYMTPRAWLSTWSAISSRANTLACLPKVTVPTLIMTFSRDNLIFRCDPEAMYEHSRAADKVFHRLPGDHLGQPCRDEAMKVITEWLEERFPAR